jgi:predicted O-methyltransferase YrrM
MNNLQKIFKAFKEIIKRPSLINLIVSNDYVWNDYLAKHYHSQTTLGVIDIEDLIPNFNEKLNTFAFLGGGSLPTDIILLKALSAQIKDCQYFEIGTWRGESVINVAEKAKECYTLNLSKKEIIDLGLPVEYAELHGFFSKGKKNIIHLEGNSLSYDFASLNKKFDLVFIDGNHKYDFVKNDTKKVFKHLLHDDSIVVWHDYAYDPETPRPEVLAGILDGIPKKYRDNLYHVSNTMCAVFTKKEYTTKDINAMTIPKRVFETSLKVKSL